MKRILLIAGIAFSLVACGDSDNTDGHGEASNADADHSAHANAGNTGTYSTVDSSAAGEGDMMSLMTGMMTNMKGMQSTGDPDHDFAALMKVHHVSAIEMARLEGSRGQDAWVKGLANKMVTDQEREVAAFNNFLSSGKKDGGGDAYFKQAITIMNGMGMEMDHSAPMDMQFVQMMIPHHQTGVDMAKAYLQGGAKDEEMKKIANQIMSSQQKEIDLLNDWMKKQKK